MECGQAFMTSDSIEAYPPSFVKSGWQQCVLLHHKLV